MNDAKFEFHAIEKKISEHKTIQEGLIRCAYRFKQRSTSHLTKDIYYGLLKICPDESQTHLVKGVIDHVLHENVKGEFSLHNLSHKTVSFNLHFGQKDKKFPSLKAIQAEEDSCFINPSKSTRFNLITSSFFGELIKHRLAQQYRLTYAITSEKVASSLFFLCHAVECTLNVSVDRRFNAIKQTIENMAKISGVERMMA